MTKTVGEIAAENPSSVRVFEKYEIDYCCGGRIPLADACRARGIQAADLERELSQAAAGRPVDESGWNTAPLGLLIDHILSTHHVYLKRELPRLRVMLGKVLAAHGDHHPDSLVPLSRIFDGLRDELESHMAKEEMILFPAIRNGFGMVSGPIRVLEHEHDSAGRALAAMRRVTAGYALPQDACNTYRALFSGLQEMETDLHRHIHLENNVLFPRAMAV
jgi:regulator of cell morphogenesis and NO signaling